MNKKSYAKLRKVLAPIIKFVMRIKVFGKENEPSEETPLLVCSNHVSWIDPILISVALHRKLRYMAKKELFGIPLVKNLIKSFGAYPVDRKNSDVGAIKNTISFLKDKGDSVLMFPQGTRCAGKEPKETKIRNGVGMIWSRTEVSVLPVHIKVKKYKVIPFRKINIIIGKPIAYSVNEESGTDKKEYLKMSQLIFDKICELSD